MLKMKFIPLANKIFFLFRSKNWFMKIAVAQLGLKIVVKKYHEIMKQPWENASRRWIYNNEILIEDTNNWEMNLCWNRFISNKQKRKVAVNLYRFFHPYMIRLLLENLEVWSSYRCHRIRYRSISLHDQLSTCKTGNYPFIFIAWSK